VSLVLTASTAAVALAAPFAGVVADRFGRKRVIVLSALLLACHRWSGGLRSLPQMLVWRFWQGVFTPGIFAVTIAYVNDEWEQGSARPCPPTSPGRCSVASAADDFGPGGGTFSWRWSFIALAALDAACAAAMWAWLPADRHFSAPGMGLPRRVPCSAIFATRRWRPLTPSASAFCSPSSHLHYVNFYLAAPPFRLGTTALG